MYTERLILLTPNFAFDRLVIRQQQLEEGGWLNLSTLQIPSIIVLKKPLGCLPTGTKLFWCCGGLEDMKAFLAFGYKKDRIKGCAYHNIEFIDPAAVGNLPILCRGIDFEGDDPSENEWMIRYPTRYYACHIPRAAYSLGR